MALQEPVTKNLLIDLSKVEFLKAGYSLWEDSGKSQAFDYIAVEDSNLDVSQTPNKIITKNIVDFDFFKKHVSIQLLLISKLISGVPLLIGLYSSGKEISDLTLYRRHNISAISLETLRKLLHSERGSKFLKISKFAHRGGIFVNLSHDLFKERRERLKLEMSIISNLTGISRHALYRYEKGESFPKIESFILLSEILGEDLDVPIEIFEVKTENITQETLNNFKLPRSKLQKEVADYLAEKEFSVLWFKSEPFDGLSEPNIEGNLNIRKKNSFPILTGVATPDESINSNRIQTIESLSRFLKKKAFWFTEDENISNSTCIEDLSFKILHISDLESMPPEEFFKLIKSEKT
ncbi:helix-turn-helix domain-containing protein [Candidatus Hodarchaeum mangrovi]